MIALLFALLVVCMILSFFALNRVAYSVFAVTFLLSLYWLKYHATSVLTIQL